MALDGLNSTNGQNPVFDEPIKYEEKDLKDIQKMQSIFAENYNQAMQSLRDGDLNGDGEVTKEDLPLLSKLINKFQKFADDIYNFTLTKVGKKAMENFAKKFEMSEKDVEKKYLALNNSCQNFINNQLGKINDNFRKAEKWNTEINESLTQHKTLIESTNSEDLSDIKALQTFYQNKKNEIDSAFTDKNEKFMNIVSSTYSELNNAIQKLQAHIDEINLNNPDDNQAQAIAEPDQSDADSVPRTIQWELPKQQEAMEMYNSFNTPQGKTEARYPKLFNQPNYRIGKLTGFLQVYGNILNSSQIKYIQNEISQLEARAKEEKQEELDRLAERENEHKKEQAARAQAWGEGQREALKNDPRKNWADITKYN